VTGRRAYQRFRESTPLEGQLRISSDVAVELNGRTSDIAVLSDSPAIVGEELTLALSNGAGQMEFRVRVLESRPEMVERTVRHRLRLEILSAVSNATPRSE
jgi:hypothetical protein